MKSFKKQLTIKAILSVFSIAFVALFIAQSAFAATLSANTAYTLELTKVNSDGTTTLVSSTSTTSDSTGKITFTFSNVPTQSTNNFLIVTVKDSTGTVQIKSFAPAPAASGTNTLGVNTTTTAQANLMEKLGVVIGTDDPIVVSFGLMITRNPNLSTTDIGNFATIAQEAIINGMETYMTSNGASTAQMATFKSKLVYNATASTTDLRDFTALTKASVDTPASAKEDMAKASGLISAAFVDAAAAANIDLDLILAAFDSAGINLQSGAGATAMAALSTAFQTSMNQSVNSFFTQLATVKVKQRYSAALTALNATTAEKTRFDTGVTTMSTDMGTADSLFASYFDGTTGYDMTETLATAFAASRLSNTGVINTLITAATLATTDTIQTAMDAVYQKAFTSFSTAIQSTNTEIGDMQTGVSSALGGTPTATQLASSGVGTYRDFNGNTLNWPIPQTASVNFIASAISAGGTLTYSRTTLAVPSIMSWLNAGSGTRTTFNTGNTSFNNLLSMQEDVMIAENTRFSIFAGSGNPSQTQMQNAKASFITNLAAIVANIGGTTDSTTAFTTAQKKALVQAQQQPSLH